MRKSLLADALISLGETIAIGVAVLLLAAMCLDMARGDRMPFKDVPPTTMVDTNVMAGASSMADVGRVIDSTNSVDSSYFVAEPSTNSVLGRLNTVTSLVSPDTRMSIVNTLLTITREGAIVWQEDDCEALVDARTPGIVTNVLDQYDSTYQLVNLGDSPASTLGINQSIQYVSTTNSTLQITVPGGIGTKDWGILVSAGENSDVTLDLSGFTGSTLLAQDASATDPLPAGKSTMLTFSQVADLAGRKVFVMSRQEMTDVSPAD